MGAPRISCSMRFGTRVDRDQSMEDKLTSVEEKMAVAAAASEKELDA